MGVFLYFCHYSNQSPTKKLFFFFALILTKTLPKIGFFSFCALILTKTLPKRVFFSISPSFGVYISQLIRFARMCSNVDDFNNRNLFLTAKLLKQGYRYHKIRKAFSKFYHRHSELIVKYNIGLKLFCNKAYQNLYFMVI